MRGWGLLGRRFQICPRIFGGFIGQAAYGEPGTLLDVVLQRVCCGVYLYPLTRERDGYTVDRIAKTLRRGEYSYISNESALSEFGAISELPVDRLTVMTTGRRGVYRTTYGVIEFTHTRRSVLDILADSRGNPPEK